jgi:hypothetical protein
MLYQIHQDLLDLMAAHYEAETAAIDQMLEMMATRTALIAEAVQACHARQCTGEGCRCDLAEELYWPQPSAL